MKRSESSLKKGNRETRLKKNSIFTFSVIRRFYEYNNIYFKEYNNIYFKGKFFTNGKGKRAKEINEKELTTPNKLKEILDATGVSAMERAMFMMQLQSGLGKIFALHWKYTVVPKL